MKNLWAITSKETRAYFSMPSAYIVGAMFLILTGVFFVSDVSRPFAEAGVRGLIDWASFFTIFLPIFKSSAWLRLNSVMVKFSFCISIGVR